MTSITSSKSQVEAQLKANKDKALLKSMLLGIDKMRLGLVYEEVFF
jgi:hypothetical protein